MGVEAMPTIQKRRPGTASPWDVLRTSAGCSAMNNQHIHMMGSRIDTCLSPVTWLAPICLALWVLSPHSESQDFHKP